MGSVVFWTKKGMGLTAAAKTFSTGFKIVSLMLVEIVFSVRASFRVKMARRLFLGGHLREKGFGAFTDLLLGQVLRVGGNHPLIAERILDASRAVSPEH